MRMRRMILVALALLALGAVALAEATPPQVGDACPDFELETLDGGAFRLSDCRGKVVFINIWATWCPPCVAEMPSIQQLAEAHPDDLVVLGVSLDDAAGTVEAFVGGHGYTYPIAMEDAESTVSRKLFPTFAVPNSIFLDADGVVTYARPGGLSYAQMEYLFADALARGEKAPEP